MAAVSHTKTERGDEIFKWVFICEECLTDRPQKKLTANFGRGKKKKKGKQTHSLTQDVNCHRLQNMQRQKSSLPLQSVDTKAS